MKVLIATGLYYPEIGGPATHTAILERELPSRGVEVVTVAFGRVRKYPKIIRHVVYTLQLFSKARGAKVIYALDPVSVGLPALIVATLMRKRLVLRVAGDYAWEQAKIRYKATRFLDDFVTRMREQPIPIRILGFVERFVARRAWLIVVPSEYLKKIVLAWGHLEDTKVRVIYTAFSPIVIQESKEANRAMLGYKGTVIASAGRLVPWKGFRRLIDVVADLTADFPDIHLVIVGDGPELAALSAHAKEAGIPDRVMLTGRMSQEGLARAIAASDIFVLNTAYEGFSHQLLEVMSLKVPIVATNVGGNPELITHNKEGMLIPYDDRSGLRDALTHLLRSAEDRARFVAAAHERVHSFTVERMLADVHDVLTHAATD